MGSWSTLHPDSSAGLQALREKGGCGVTAGDPSVPSLRGHQASLATEAWAWAPIPPTPRIVTLAAASGARTSPGPGACTLFFALSPMRWGCYFRSPVGEDMKA